MGFILSLLFFFLSVNQVPRRGATKHQFQAQLSKIIFSSRKRNYFSSENETEQEDFLAFETVGLVQDFLWGLLEPSGEECVAVDSALKVRIMDKLI